MTSILTCIKIKAIILLLDSCIYSNLRSNHRIQRNITSCVSHQMGTDNTYSTLFKQSLPNDGGGIIDANLRLLPNKWAHYFKNLQLM